jgi:hypothetical protein
MISVFLLLINSDYNKFNDKTFKDTCLIKYILVNQDNVTITLNIIARTNYIQCIKFLLINIVS